MARQDTTNHEPMAADEQQEAVAEIVREHRRVEQRRGRRASLAEGRSVQHDTLTGPDAEGRPHRGPPVLVGPDEHVRPRIAERPRLARVLVRRVHALRHVVALRQHVLPGGRLGGDLRAVARRVEDRPVQRDPLVLAAVPRLQHHLAGLADESRLSQSLTITTSALARARHHSELRRITADVPGGLSMARCRTPQVNVR